MTRSEALSNITNLINSSHRNDDAAWDILNYIETEINIVWQNECIDCGVPMENDKIRCEECFNSRNGG